MLRATDILRALKLSKAAGERPSGHFDHDANGFSGPARAALDKPATESLGDGPQAENQYEAAEDERTGDRIYVKRHKR